MTEHDNCYMQHKLTDTFLHERVTSNLAYLPWH